MKLTTLVQSANGVVEAKLDQAGDKVNRLIQKELWPIVKQLEIQTKSGPVLKRDKDGAVLAQLKEKSLELISQYSGKNQHNHTTLVQTATDYQSIIKLMTNVMMYNLGQGVIKESILAEVYGFSQKAFNETRSADLTVTNYELYHVEGGEVVVHVNVTSDSIAHTLIGRATTPEMEECLGVVVTVTGQYNKMHNEWQYHVDVMKDTHNGQVEGCEALSAEFHNAFVSKYSNDQIEQWLNPNDQWFMSQLRR